MKRQIADNLKYANNFLLLVKADIITNGGVVLTKGHYIIVES